MSGPLDNLGAALPEGSCPVLSGPGSCPVCSGLGSGQNPPSGPSGLGDGLGGSGPCPPDLWARVTASRAGGDHDWVEVVPGPDGTWSDGGRTGTAYEANGNQVPAGIRVRLINDAPVGSGPESCEYVFEHCCTAGPEVDECSNVLAGVATGGDICYFFDGTLGTDCMALAIADTAVTSSHSVTEIGPSFGSTAGDELEGWLATADPETDLLIMLINSGSSSGGGTGMFDSDTVDAVRAWVASGGRAIVSFNSDVEPLSGSTFGAHIGDSSSIPAGPKTIQFIDGCIGTGLTDTPICGTPLFYTDEWFELSPYVSGPEGGSAIAMTFEDTGNGAAIISNCGRTIYNGFLPDGFDDSDQGRALYVREILCLVG